MNETNKKLYFYAIKKYTIKDDVVVVSPSSSLCHLHIIIIYNV